MLSLESGCLIMDGDRFCLENGRISLPRLTAADSGRHMFLRREERFAVSFGHNAACDVSAFISSSGSFFPLRSARFKIPLQAFGDSSYLFMCSMKSFSLE